MRVAVFALCVCVSGNMLVVLEIFEMGNICKHQNVIVNVNKAPKRKLVLLYANTVETSEETGIGELLFYLTRPSIL